MTTESNSDRILDLSESLKDFLEVWSMYKTSVTLKDIYADDPIWDWVPIIQERAEQVWTATFIGFWLPDGQYAFPAVTTQNTSFRSGDRIIRRGQSIRDAYLKKGAKWITEGHLILAKESQRKIVSPLSETNPKEVRL